MRTTCAAIFVAFSATLGSAPAQAAENKQDCISVSDVMIVAGAEAPGTKRLCRTPGSVRYNLVEAAVFNAALTRAAFDKVSDPQLRTMRGEIGRLQAQVDASKGEATAVSEALARAQEVFVAQLAAKDRAYGEAIAQFRGTVDDIASTPEGAAALAQYNAGNEAEAIAVLDRLNAANDAARQKRNDVESAAEKRQIAYLAHDARNKGKVSLESVIVRYEDVTKLDPGVFGDWIELARLKVLAGRLPDAVRALEAAQIVAQSDRERSIADSSLGSVLLLRGDLAGAEQAFARTLVIFRRVAAADPGNAQAQRDFKVGLIMIGDVRALLGDHAGADQAYGESLVIAYRLATANPGSALALRDLAVSLGRIGDVRAGQGDLAGADRVHGLSLTLRRRLATADPGNAQVQHDLSIGLEKIGEVRARQGDLAGADQAYDESLALARRLAAADPGNAQAQRALSIGLEKIGDVRARQGELAGSDLAYGESLAIARRLAAADPGNAQAQRGLSVGLSKIGDVRARQGELAGADLAYGESLAIARRLAAADPGNAEAQRDLAAAMHRLAGRPNYGVRWRDVAAQFEAIAAKGLLAPADQPFLDKARRLAAQEQAE